MSVIRLYNSLKSVELRAKLRPKVRLRNSCSFNPDIVDSNEKLVLGMVFQIIIKYLKFEDDDGNSSGDVKEALMLW